MPNICLRRNKGKATNNDVRFGLAFTLGADFLFRDLRVFRTLVTISVT